VFRIPQEFVPLVHGFPLTGLQLPVEISTKQLTLSPPSVHDHDHGPLPEMTVATDPGEHKFVIGFTGVAELTAIPQETLCPLEGHEELAGAEAEHIPEQSYVPVLVIPQEFALLLHD